MADENNNGNPIIESKADDNGAFSAHTDPTYSKESLISDDSWSLSENAILKIVLEDNKKYSLADAKEAIKEFKGGI